jgi:CO dehydrogenase maturation factor
MKIAVSGKGGVGKTTLASLLASMYAADGRRVVAIDADPASSLPAALGVPPEASGSIVPLSSMLDLIEERTGARPGAPGGLFALNPRVDDLVDRFALDARGVKVMVLGTISGPGEGCFCPESSLLRALLRHLVLERDEVVVVDMEAGLEHLGRSTLQAIDVLLIVVEPGRRSADTARRIASMAGEMGVKDVQAVLNKAATPEQAREVRSMLDGLECVASIPWDPRLVDADLAGAATVDSGAGPVLEAVRGLKLKLDRRAEGP